MLRWAIMFAILALIAGVLGFGGLAGDFEGIAKILLLVFLVLFVVAFVMGRGRRPSPDEADRSRDSRRDANQGRPRARWRRPAAGCSSVRCRQGCWTTSVTTSPTSRSGR